MQTVKEDVSAFVKWFFDTDNANRTALAKLYPIGKQFISRCLSLSNADKCPEFTAAVERILHDLIGPRGLVSNDYQSNVLDRVWSLDVFDQERHIWYVVVISALLPLITVRATTGHTGEGPDARWVLPPSGSRLFDEINDGVKRLADQVSPLASTHGYTYVSWDDEALQQTIMYKYFTGRWSQVAVIPIKAWDFMIFTDIEDEEG